VSLRSLTVPSLAGGTLVRNIAQATVTSIISIVSAAGVITAQVFVRDADSVGSGGGRLELVQVFCARGDGSTGAGAIDDRARLDA
jgi:hypothetical protein